MTKFLIDYDHDPDVNFEPALDMLDQLQDRGKAQSNSGRIVEVDDDLADGLMAVLRALGIQPIEILAEKVIDDKPAGDGCLSEITPAVLERQAHELDADLMVAPLQGAEAASEQPIDGRPAVQDAKSGWPKCEICGEPFWPKRKDSRLCGKPECKKEDMRRRNQAEHAKFKDEVAAASKGSEEVTQADSAGERGEDPFAGMDPSLIWIVKDRPGLEPMTIMEFAEHMTDRTITPGTILLRRYSIYPWEIYEERPGVLGVREVIDRNGLVIP